MVVELSDCDVFDGVSESFHWLVISASHSNSIPSFHSPMFLSTQYAIYTTAHPLTPSNPHASVRVLPKSLYGKNAPPESVPHSFFSHWYGSSWHADDAGLITFLGNSGKYLMYIGMLCTAIFGFRMWSHRNGGSGSNRIKVFLGRALESGRGGYYQMMPTSASSSSLPSEDTEAYLTTSPDLSDCEGDTTRFVDLARRTGHIILAVPAIILAAPTPSISSSSSSSSNKNNTFPLLRSFLTPTSPSKRSSRPRTASMADGPLPSHRNEIPGSLPSPPPYDSGIKEKDEAMDEVDAFLQQAER